MDEKLAQATLNALARQREQALNAAAQLEAQLEVVTAENHALKAQLKQRDADQEVRPIVPLEAGAHANGAAVN